MSSRGATVLSRCIVRIIRREGQARQRCTQWEEGRDRTAMTQLRRRLIVSLGKTKGIWNNGQIGAFMQCQSSSPTPIRTPCARGRASKRGWLGHRRWIVRRSSHVRYQNLWRSFVAPVRASCAPQLRYVHTAALGGRGTAHAPRTRGRHRSTLHSRAFLARLNFKACNGELRGCEMRADTSGYTRLCTPLFHDEFYSRGRWPGRGFSLSLCEVFLKSLGTILYICERISFSGFSCFLGLPSHFDYSSCIHFIFERNMKKFLMLCLI